jgi:hypothetical protein
MHGCRGDWWPVSIDENFRQAWYVPSLRLIYMPTNIFRSVTLGGAVLFLLFAVIYLYEAFYDDSIDPSLLPS